MPKISKDLACSKYEENIVTCVEDGGKDDAQSAGNSKRA